MSMHDKVSWKDGMFLLPQHFQQAERSHEAASRLRHHGALPLGWGLSHLEMNDAAVAQGRLEIVRCRAIMPDGTPVDIPEGDPAPQAHTFELPATADTTDVFLALPARRPRSPAITDEKGRSDVRYVEHTIEVPDDHDPSRTQLIDVAAKNLRLAVTGDDLDGMILLRIARVRRGADGMTTFDNRFVPPCLHLAAAPTLQRLGRELLGAVSARVRALAEEQRRLGTSRIVRDPQGLLRFSFLHALNAHLPVLQHLIDHPATTPNRLFEEMLRLAGSLATFAAEPEALPGPQFSLETLTDAFTKMDRRIRELLAVPFTTRYEIIPLAKQEVFWTGHIEDSELCREGEFVLYVTSELEPAEIIARLPNACKIAETDAIERLIRIAVGGARISHLPSPPTVIPAREDAACFRVHTEGEDWLAIRETGLIAAYVPTWLPVSRLELIGIRAEGSPAGHGGASRSRPRTPIH